MGRTVYNVGEGLTAGAYRGVEPALRYFGLDEAADAAFRQARIRERGIADNPGVEYGWDRPIESALGAAATGFASLPFAAMPGGLPALMLAASGGNLRAQEQLAEERAAAAGETFDRGQFDPNYAAAYGTGAVQGALERYLGGERFLGRGAASVAQSTGRRFASQGARGAIEEALAEGASQFLEIAQADLDTPERLLEADAWADIGQQALLGAIGGGAVRGTLAAINPSAPTLAEAQDAVGALLRDRPAARPPALDEADPVQAEPDGALRALGMLDEVPEGLRDAFLRPDPVEAQIATAPDLSVEQKVSLLARYREARDRREANLQGGVERPPGQQGEANWEGRPPAQPLALSAPPLAAESQRSILEDAVAGMQPEGETEQAPPAAPPAQSRPQAAPASPPPAAQAAPAQAPQDSAGAAAPQPADPRAAARAQGVIDAFLADMAAPGGQSKLAADAARATIDAGLNEGRFTAPQVQAALEQAKILADILPTRSNYLPMFLNDLFRGGDPRQGVRLQGRATPAAAMAGDDRVALTERGLSGIVELALDPGSMAISRETAAHEGYHIIRRWLEANEPQTIRRLDEGFPANAQGLHDIRDADASVIRALKRGTHPSGQDYFTYITSQDYGFGPGLHRNSEEAQATVFGALYDMRARGQTSMGLRPVFARVLTLIERAVRALRRAPSVADQMEGFAAGRLRNRPQAIPGGEDEREQREDAAGGVAAPAGGRAGPERGVPAVDRPQQPEAGAVRDAGGPRGSERRVPVQGEPDAEVERGPRVVGQTQAGEPIYEVYDAASQAETPLAGVPRQVRIKNTPPEWGLPGQDSRGAVFRVGPLAAARRAAEGYMRSTGRDYRPPTDYARADPERGGRIAAAFDAMANDPASPLVRQAYEQMGRETLAQWQAIAATGLQVEFYPTQGEDPYRSNPWNAHLDVARNNHLYVFPTEWGYSTDAEGNPIIPDADREANPMLADTGIRWRGRPVLLNDLFRAVHDYFGHIKEGFGFRADGEENAWRSHAAMYSPLARLAMTSETRGQNSWLNFGPYAQRNQTAATEDTVFAEQKLGLMPEWVAREGAENFLDPLPADLAQRLAAIQPRESARSGLDTFRWTSNGKIGQYDPNYFAKVEDPLLDEEGRVLAARDRLEPKPNLVQDIEDLGVRPQEGIIFRGMSAGEYENFLRSGEIRSNGSYNLQGQDGLTYFSTDPRSAQSYANGFAPEEFKPTFDRPAYIVAARAPAPSDTRRVPGTGNHEIGVTRPIRAEEVTAVYRGNVVAYVPAQREGGFYAAPTAFVHWEQLPGPGRESARINPDELEREFFDRRRAYKADLFTERNGWNMRRSTGAADDARAQQALARYVDEAMSRPEFRSWFDGSKVVGANGRPLVVFHSTMSAGEFTTFRPASHFGTLGAANDRLVDNSLDRASRMIGNPAYREAVASGDPRPPGAEPLGPNDAIIPVFLSIKNPARRFDVGNLWYPEIEIARAGGRDGIVYANRFEDPGSDSWIAFDPSQIRPVFGYGTWESARQPTAMRPNGELLYDAPVPPITLPSGQVLPAEFFSVPSDIALTLEGLPRVRWGKTRAGAVIETMPEDVVRAGQRAEGRVLGILTDEVRAEPDVDTGVKGRYRLLGLVDLIAEGYQGTPYAVWSAELARTVRRHVAPDTMVYTMDYGDDMRDASGRSLGGPPNIVPSSAFVTPDRGAAFGAVVIDVEREAATLSTHYAVLHEAVHAATLSALDDIYTGQTARDRLLRAAMNAILDDARGFARKNGMLQEAVGIGAGTIEYLTGERGNYQRGAQEIIAEGLSSPYFQRFLGAIPVSNKTDKALRAAGIEIGGRRDLWGSLVGFIKRTLGLAPENSLLDALMAFAPQAMNDPAPYAVRVMSGDPAAAMAADMESARLDPETKAFLDRVAPSPAAGYVARALSNKPWKQGMRAQLRQRMRAHLVDRYTALEDDERVLTGQSRLPAELSGYVAMWQADDADRFVATMVETGGALELVQDPRNPRNSYWRVNQDKSKGMGWLQDLIGTSPDAETTEARLKAFQAYALIKRGTRLNSEGIPNQISAADLKIARNITARHPEVVRAYQGYQRFNQNLMDQMVKADLISAEDARAFMAHNDYYPFYRAIPASAIGLRKIAGIGARFKPKEIEGGVDPFVENPLEVIFNNLAYWTHAGMRNVAKQKVIDTGLKTGSIVRAKPSDPQDGVINVRVKGKSYAFTSKDPGLTMAAEAYWALPEDLHRVASIAGFPARLLRGLVTKEPTFMLYSNLIRDSLSAWQVSGSKVTPIVSTYAGLIDALRKSQPAQDYMMLGHGGSRRYEDGFFRDAADLLRDDIRIEKGVWRTDTPGKLMDTLRWAYLKWDRVSEASDMASRIAVFEAERAKGVSDAEAAWRAREVLNFTKRGNASWLALLSAMVPFTNSRIQGLDVTYQSMKTAAGGVGRVGDVAETPAQKTAKYALRAGVLASIAILAEMQFGEDEEIKDQPEWLKNTHLLIPMSALGVPEAGLLAIPKPFEFGAVFMTVPQMLFRAAMGRETPERTATAVPGAIMQSLSYNPVPTAVLPILEQAANWSMFTGRPIEGRSLSTLEPELRYTRATPAFYRDLSATLADAFRAAGMNPPGIISPQRIDHLVRGYTGSMGAYFAAAMGAMVGSEGLKATSWRDLPVVRGALRDPASSQPAGIEDLYRMVEATERLTRTMRHYRAVGDARRAQEIEAANPGLLNMRSTLNRIKARHDAMVREQRAISRDPRMPIEDKRARLAEIDKAVRALAAEVEALRRQAGR
ncbi:large polyvalent protein [Planktothrix phage Pag-Yong1]|nr:large polyvalent protein [Planktothrix phage Pag-Yong1]